jgi:hypothetical protein
VNPIISLGHSSLAIIELTIIAVVAAVLLLGTLAASDYIHFRAASMGDPPWERLSCFHFASNSFAQIGIHSTD